MELSEETIQQVRDMAAALLQPEEIAVLIGVPALERKEFCNKCTHGGDHPIATAYNQGRLQTKYELRKCVVKLAKAGSPAAQPLVDGYIRQQRMNY